jgi:succinate dehydrogenase / fumarate reductase cytochrome b subunit
MAEGSARPLSPHVQVWCWHLTMAVSIAHRLTGMLLYLGALILAGWALTLAQGRDAFDAYTGLFMTWPGRAVLMLVTFSGFFHLANGVRHLAWDVGKGFQPRTAGLTAWIVIAFAVVTTVAFWWRLSAYGAFAHG